MNIKKLGVYFVVAMLMISFALGSASTITYAEIPNKIGIGNLTEDDLVATWYFDEDSGDVVKDYKGNYDGIANGTAIVDTPYGKGRSFNGVDEYIEFENSIIPIGKKSIRFKIKRSNLEIEQAERILSTTGSSIECEGGISIWLLPDKTINIGVANGESNWSIRLKSSIDICDNQWHDFLFTWDGTTSENSAKLYIDNITIPNSQNTATSLDTTSQHNLIIGQFSNSCYFKGELSQIEIYNEAYIPSPAPTNLTTTPGNKEVNLSWDEVDNAQSYIVKRSTTEGGPYKTIAENILGRSYTDEGLDNGTTYYYVVCAVHNGATSPNSNEASATPEGSSGNGDNALLRITMSNGKINEYDLSMTDVEDFIDWYEDRSDDRGKPYYIIEKDYNIGPFESRKDYLAFDKILQFEVMEYNK